jgi:hypothetical protein
MNMFFAVWRAMAWLPDLFDNLVLLSSASLELAITEAVKAEPGCEAFVGVFVKAEESKSCCDANWSIRGVKFGRTDRDKSSKVLASIVERMQRELRLSEDSSAVASATQSAPRPSVVEVTASRTGENQPREHNRNHTPRSSKRMDDLNGQRA